MAGKKDKAVVAVISGLTDTQASMLMKDIMRAKSKNAPYGRGTIAVGTQENVGGLLQKGHRKCLEVKK